MTHPNPSTTAEGQEELSAQAADTSNQDQSQDPQQSGQSNDQSQADELPEKFKGKSAADIYASYRELEKKLGSMSSEQSHNQKEKDDLLSRVGFLEEQLVARATPQATEEDPLSNIESEVDADPVEAVKKLARALTAQGKGTRETLLKEIRKSQATEHFQRQMQDNPDFKALEPEMRQLARQVAPMVKPEFLESPAMIDALYLIAKGRNLPRYVKEAEEKAKKAVDLVKSEKRNAFSESAQGGQGTGSKKAEDMSLDELRSLLGVAGD